MVREDYYKEIVEKISEFRYELHYRDLLHLFDINFFSVTKINRLLHDTVLPNIAFVWGEEIRRFKKMEKRRNNIIWCIVIGTIVSVIGGVLVNRFFLL